MRELKDLAAELPAVDALRFVQAWNREYNRRPTPPSRREVEELSAAFETAKPALDRPTREALSFMVRLLRP